MWTLECDGDILQGTVYIMCVMRRVMANPSFREKSLASAGEEISLRSNESRQ